MPTSLLVQSSSSLRFRSSHLCLWASRSLGDTLSIGEPGWRVGPLACPDAKLGCLGGTCLLGRCRLLGDDEAYE